MFKLGVSSVLAVSFMATNAVAETYEDLGVPTPDMYDYNLTIEQAICRDGLKMSMMDIRDNPVSDYDGVPLTAEDVLSIQQDGADLVAQYCPNMV